MLQEGNRPTPEKSASRSVGWVAEKPLSDNLCQLNRSMQHRPIS